MQINVKYRSHCIALFTYSLKKTLIINRLKPIFPFYFNYGTIWFRLMVSILNLHSFGISSFYNGIGSAAGQCHCHCRPAARSSGPTWSIDALRSHDIGHLTALLSSNNVIYFRFLTFRRLTHSLIPQKILLLIGKFQKHVYIFLSPCKVY